jgi:serine/threonine protein phosphatase PrpC
MALRIVGAGRTDVGIVRAGNEDNYLMIPDEGAYIVADGMGGHAAGEVASEMAVRIVARELVGAAEDPHDAASERMRGALRTANDQIFQRTVEEQDKRGMGTTVTAMLVNGPKYLIGQVGDSRAYILRDDRFEQLTKDHSYVQEQVDAGYLTPEQARVHPYSNVITRCVGANEDVWPDVYAGTLHENDLYLLASDGLTGMLEDHEVAEILMRDTDLEQKLEELIADGNARGGLDNITAVLVRVDAD